MVEQGLDPVMGRAIGADGVGTAVATFFGGSPTTTYAENIGVMPPPHMRDEGALISVGGRDTQRVDEFVEDPNRADERVDDLVDDEPEAER